MSSNILPLEPGPSDKDMMDNMVAIPIREFISGTRLPIDVFIRLSDMKFVLLVRAGDIFQVDRAVNYEQKQVEQLYVRKDDYAKYLKQSLAIAGIVVSREDIENRKKLEILSTTLSSVCKTLSDSGLDTKILEQTRIVLMATIELVESKQILGDLLLALSGLSDEVLAHSMAVAVVSSGMGHAAGWTQTTTLEKLALGGLFHEIGVRQLPKELIVKPLALMNFEEVLLYESHVSRGQQIMQSLGFIPEDILSIIYEHHENQAGQGYPRRLKSVRIHPLAKIVSLADAFCELVLKNKDNPSPRSGVDAVVHINQNMGPLFAKEALRALDQFIYPVVRPKSA